MNNKLTEKEREEISKILASFADELETAWENRPFLAPRTKTYKKAMGKFESLLAQRVKQAEIKGQKRALEWVDDLIAEFDEGALGMIVDRDEPRDELI